MTVAAAALAVAVAAPETGWAEPDWRELLERAVQQGSNRSLEGRLVVVSFNGGPTIGQVVVTQDDDGRVVVDEAESWVLGHVGGESFFGDREAGTLLRFGNPTEDGFDLDRLADKYRVSVVRSEDTVAGEAAVIEVAERDGSVLRERLWIDRSSGVVVRRETYAGDGTPVRLTAYTALELAPVRLPEVDVEFEQQVSAAHTEVRRTNLEVLRDTGWTVPERLSDGFDLVETSALGGDDRSTLHLLYSDGLYRLSVYQQHGRLDEAALDRRGARRVGLGQVSVWRWPGSEPATYVWEGAGTSFTAVSDAPPDVLAAALAVLPHDGPTLAERMRVRLRRLLDAAWPFG